MLMTHGGRRAKRFDWAFGNDYVRIKNENERQEEYSLAEVFAVLGWLTVRAAKKSAGRRNDVAKKQAVRIILIGNAVIAGMAMMLMVYLSIEAGVL